MRARLTVLDVLLHGQAIGTLTLLPGDQILFAFNQVYIDDPNRPTLSLSFKDAIGGLITEIRPTRKRVPPFFSNLLPEGAMRGYLAGHAGVNERRELFLLWVLGRDLPGCITIHPAESEAWPPGENHGEQGGQGHDGQTSAFRFSLAGAQLKFPAVMDAAGGLTIPVEGVGGSWILKLPSMKFEGMPENEFAMMALARKIGIDVPEIRLIALDSVSRLPEGMGRLKGSALAVQRFDRNSENGPIHMEDFTQVFGVYPERKYERASYRNIAEVIWAEIGAQGIAEFVRRLVFNALIGNADMHLKNWSLIYPDQRHAALAPGYDFVSTIAYIEDDNMALSLVKSKKMSEMSRDSLTYFAAKARLPEKLVLDASLETAQRFMEAWTQERGHLPLSSHMIETIDAHVQKIRLVRESVKS